MAPTRQPWGIHTERVGIDMVVKFKLGYEDTPTAKRYKFKKR